MADRVDLNCDMGESFGAWKMGADREVLGSVSSANIACGFHAGDPAVMRETVRLARNANVAVGAHPGFPDLIGFGRRDMRVTPDEAENMTIYQIGALAAIAAAEGARLRHVKAHGALYNMAARDPALAAAIARAIAAVDRSLVMFGLAGSHMLDIGSDHGLQVASEAFADRAYEPDGSLTPRGRPGAVIHDPDLVVRRAVKMVREGTVTAVDGREIALKVDTLCTHGDTPGAHMLVQRLREGLQHHRIAIAPPGEREVRV
jgi:UPF0271 protein